MREMKNCDCLNVNSTQRVNGLHSKVRNIYVTVENEIEYKNT